ncbi:MAG: DUF1150 family protein [Alphaproteobacteria bacterium]|nr:DUF1150 family protein [Alphaproteobacteria bacterium]
MVETPEFADALAGAEAGPFGSPIAYVKGVLIDGALLFAIHDGAGRQIGLAPNRDVAFAAARQYDFAPVSVH